MRDYELETKTLNKYLGNGNYHAVGMEYTDRYCSKRDVNNLEYQDYTGLDPNEDPKSLDDHYLTLNTNFISNVELTDLMELAVKLDEHFEEIEEHDYKDEIYELKKNMKSLSRILHRFRNTRDYQIPVTESMSSRGYKTLWS